MFGVLAIELRRAPELFSELLTCIQYFHTQCTTVLWLPNLHEREEFFEFFLPVSCFWCGGSFDVGLPLPLPTGMDAVVQHCYGLIVMLEILLTCLERLRTLHLEWTSLFAVPSRGVCASSGAPISPDILRSGFFSILSEILDLQVQYRRISLPLVS